MKNPVARRYADALHALAKDGNLRQKSSASWRHGQGLAG